MKVQQIMKVKVVGLVRFRKANLRQMPMKKQVHGNPPVDQTLEDLKKEKSEGRTLFPDSSKERDDLPVGTVVAQIFG